MSEDRKVSVDNGAMEARRYPLIGTVCYFHQPEHETPLASGTRKHAAILTRVWGSDCVNLYVLPDCGTPKFYTSVPRAFYNGQAWGFEEKIR